MTDTYKVAQAYVEAGFSVVPLRGKVPWHNGRLLPWKEYQQRRPDASELYEWFYGRENVNIGIVCGSISGDLLVADWDDAHLYQRWKTEYPELAKTATVKTGGGGRHTYFYLAATDGLTAHPSYSVHNTAERSDATVAWWLARHPFTRTALHIDGSQTGQQSSRWNPWPSSGLTWSSLKGLGLSPGGRYPRATATTFS